MAKQIGWNSGCSDTQESGHCCPVRGDAVCVIVDGAEPQYAYPVVYLDSTGIPANKIYLSLDLELIEGSVERSDDCPCK